MNSTTYITALTAARADHQRHADALSRAILEADCGNIPTRVNGEWQMRSSDGTQVYIIDHNNGCNCTAGTNHKLCKHMAAIHIAEAVEAAERIDTAEPWPDIDAMTLDDVLHCEKVA